MIKSVQSLIGKMEAEFSTVIRRHIYAELQDFIQFTIKDALNKAIKHKKDFITGWGVGKRFLFEVAYCSIMNSIIDCCSDNFASDQLFKHGSRSSDISMKSTKKSRKLEASSLSDVRVKRRDVAPSSTQVRTTVNQSVAKNLWRCNENLCHWRILIKWSSFLTILVVHGEDDARGFNHRKEF